MNEKDRIRLYSGVLRELLLAAIESDPSVKYNFRTLSAHKQEAIRSEVNRRSQDLAAQFSELLKEKRVDVERADRERLKVLAREFLVKAAKDERGG